MSQAEHTTIAVLTGDLVGSTTLGPAKVDAAFGALERAAKDMEAWTGDSLRFTRHRGDGWQVVLTKPEYALRAALVFRASLKALGKEFDSYVGIAEGVIENDLGKNLNVALSDTFIKSGRALDTLKVMQSFKPKMASASRGSIGTAIVLADTLSNEWTETQASLIYPMLARPDNLKYTELAEQFEISRQSVTKSLHAAYFQQIYLALNLLERQTNA